MSAGAREAQTWSWPRHLPEYGIEAGALGSFMLSACLFGTLLGHPGSSVVGAIPSEPVRRVLMGIAMGLTAIAIIYSPWGRRSGAHMNPAITLTFFRLGKSAPRDAVGYVVAHFAGAIVGVLLAALALGPALAAPGVMYVVTRPGMAGVAAAFAAELVISASMMAMVLQTSSSPRWQRYTGVAAGALVAVFIVVTAPISGMSMNPARTVASALAANDWMAVWLYFVAPLAGMMLAAEVFVRQRGRAAAPCGKLMHAEPCLFCEHSTEPSGNATPYSRAANPRLAWEPTHTTTSSSSAAAPVAAHSPARSRRQDSAS